MFTLYFFQFARLLQRAERDADRIEQVERHECAILVHVELAIASTVAITTDLVQPLEGRRELVKKFQAADIFLTDLFSFLASHACNDARR